MRNGGFPGEFRDKFGREFRLFFIFAQRDAREPRIVAVRVKRVRLRLQFMEQFAGVRRDEFFMRHALQG